MGLQGMAVFVFPLAMVYAALRDVASFEVPNWLPAAMVLVFIALWLAGGQGMAVLGWHLSAGLAVLAAGWTLFAAGIMGGGDAKMLAAGALWIGWPGLAEFVLATALAGGVLALVIVALRRASLPASWTARPWMQRLRDAEQGIPYCVAIGIAGLWVFRDLPLVARWTPGLVAGS